MSFRLLLISSIYEFFIEASRRCGAPISLISINLDSSFDLYNGSRRNEHPSSSNPPYQRSGYFLTG
ncbi:unnamed protein product [Arabidopsis halleri]